MLHEIKHRPQTPIRGEILAAFDRASAKTQPAPQVRPSAEFQSQCRKLCADVFPIVEKAIKDGEFEQAQEWLLQLSMRRCLPKGSLERTRAGQILLGAFPKILDAPDAALSCVSSALAYADGNPALFENAKSILYILEDLKPSPETIPCILGALCKIRAITRSVSKTDTIEQQNDLCRRLFALNGCALQEGAKLSYRVLTKMLELDLPQKAKVLSCLEGLSAQAMREQNFPLAYDCLSTARLGGMNPQRARTHLLALSAAAAGTNRVVAFRSGMDAQTLRA